MEFLHVDMYGMDWRSAVRVALKGLAVHKVRAGLSMLGIIFGVASVVAVIAVSEGAKGEVLKQLAALGANNIYIKGLSGQGEKSEDRDAKKTTRLHSEGLTRREAEQAAQACVMIDAYAPIKVVQASVRLGEKPLDAEIVGTTPSYLNVMNYGLREGRWLSPPDEVEARRVCVLEEDLARELFPVSTAIGEALIIDHEPYSVVGVLKGKEKTDKKYEVRDTQRVNRRMYIPLNAALVRTTQNPLSDELSEVIFHCRDSAEVKTASVILERIFAAAHNMESLPPDKRDYEVHVARDLLAQIEQSQQIFNVVMLCSAGISLAVGGIGIMNIMLANVSERRREVGIRRAVGATRSDILRQFLTESLIICLGGGLIGCLLGVIFTLAVGRMTGWEVAFAWWGMAVSVGVSLLDGVAFGTYPAWKAAQLDPIEALRYE